MTRLPSSRFARFSQMLRRQSMAGPILPLALALLGGTSLLAPQASAQSSYTFRTVAGVGTLPGNTSGTQGSVTIGTLFDHPFGIVVAADGALYVSDTGNSVIRKITASGTVSTFVGTVGISGESNGTTALPNVTFSRPQGLAFDSAGNLYVADYVGATIRKVTSAGTTTTFAGTASTVGSADGTGTAAKFNQPSGVALDSAGNVFVADSTNDVIRKITPAGVVTTFAGTPGAQGKSDGVGSAASFRNPRSVACDSNGNLYVADTGNNAIRKITSAGTVTTLAGQADTFGSTDGSGSVARFSFPNGVAVDKAGNVYVADELNAVIRKITPTGDVTTLAGLAGGTGRVDGQGSAARFDHPTTLAVDSNGTVYVADYGNNLIRKVTSAGVVTTLAGTGGLTGYLDGTGYLLNPTLFQNPTHPVSDGAGNIYLTDTGNNNIRKIAADGSVAVFAGSTTSVAGSVNGTGTAALFNVPSGLTRDSSGNFYVADSANQRIRKISPDGVVVTLAGLLGIKGAVDGGGDVATFNNPTGVAADGSGNVYVADYSNHVIRLVSASGTVSTYAGTAGESGSADGMGAAARFNYPRDLALDAAGNLWVADFGNDTIRRIAPGGTVTTVAGLAGTAGTADGAAGGARFDGPAGLTVDAGGNVFIADSNNNTIRLLSASGAVSTIGGTAGVVGAADGAGSVARFNHPSGVAVDAAGNLFVADNRNNTLRKGSTGSSGSDGGSGGGSGDGSGGSGGGGTGGGSGGGSGGGGTGGGSGSTADPGAGGAYDDNTTGFGFLQHPAGMVVDGSGNLFVCDAANHCIKKIDASSVITTFAGQSGSAGTADGTGTAARFSNPTAISIDSSGNLFVADTGNSAIRKITSAGVVTTFAGTTGQSGAADGNGSSARFNAPQGVAVNLATNNVFVADSVNNTIRRITPAGDVTTFAGVAGQTGDADGIGSVARLNHPTGLAFDVFANLIVADTYNNTIRGVVTTSRTVRATASGAITTAGNAKVVITDSGLAGSPVTISVAVLAGDTAAAWATKVAAALAANSVIAARYTALASDTTISLVYVVADDGTSANLGLFNDTSAGIVDAPTSTSTGSAGSVSTIAGSAGVAGAYDGRGEYALFNLPQGLTTNSSGVLYVADTGNNCIRRLGTNGVVNTIAGIPSASGRRNGSGEQALFNQPQAVLAVGASAVVADTGNSVLRLVSILSTAADDSIVSTVPLSTSTSSGGGSSGGGSSSGGGYGGGGAPSTWFIATLGVLAAVRRWTGRKAA